MNALRCSDFTAGSKTFDVLIVGAEQPDEFAEATRLKRLGSKVIVANPRQSVAARRFANAGGTFVRSTIERIPLALGPFDLICESYPYTVARVEGFCEEGPCPVWLSDRAMRAYATPRLRRLAPGGRRILFTESPGFAHALRSIVLRDKSIGRNFTVRIVRLKAEQAPRSTYPRLGTRFKLVIQWAPTEPRLASRVHTKTAYL